MIAFSVLFFFAFVMEFSNRKHATIRETIIASIVLFSTFIIHYPTAVFACIFGLVLF